MWRQFSFELSLGEFCCLQILFSLKRITFWKSGKKKILQEEGKERKEGTHWLLNHGVCLSVCKELLREKWEWGVLQAGLMLFIFGSVPLSVMLIFRLRKCMISNPLPIRACLLNARGGKCAVIIKPRCLLVWLLIISFNNCACHSLIKW